MTTKRGELLSLLTELSELAPGLRLDQLVTKLAISAQGAKGGRTAYAENA
jgi:hypothetical protein